MSDLFRGIKNIGPAYPVNPVRPANKDRQTGKRQKKPDDRKPGNKDDDNKPLIDEHV